MPSQGQNYAIKPIERANRAGRNLFEYHPVLGYRFIPGIRARVHHEAGGYFVKANQAGFRCEHEVTAEKPADTFRILVFGDSYTAGDGVSNGHRYSDILEEHFEKTEVLNFGLPGSGTDQQYLAFREFARNIEYDLLIVSVLVENIVRNTMPARITMNGTDGQLVRRPKPYFERRGGHLLLRNTPVPTEVVAVWEAAAEERSGPVRALLRHGLKRLDEALPGTKDLVTRLRDIRHPEEYEDPNDPAWLLMKDILSMWSVEAGPHDMIICPIPTFAHINQIFRPDSYMARFQELGGHPHVEVVDPLPAFWRLNGEERASLRFPTDEHPTRKWHEVLANAIEPSVKKYHERWQTKA